MGEAEITGKTRHTAVVAIPPEEAWAPIQEIRRKHDPRFQRWMPHVTLLYPFRPEEQFEEIGGPLAEACSTVSPIETVLGEFRYFVHGSGRATLWLAAEPEGAYSGLQTALQQAIPDCDDVSLFEGGFTPHLSVGQVESEDSAEKLSARLQRNWSPLRFGLSKIAVLRRDADSPFQVASWISLSG